VAIPQVRICAGGVGQPASLPRPLYGKFHQHLDARFVVHWLVGHFVPKPVSEHSSQECHFLFSFFEWLRINPLSALGTKNDLSSPLSSLHVTGKWFSVRKKSTK
jgi:hypothetical protein